MVMTKAAIFLFYALMAQLAQHLIRNQANRKMFSVQIRVRAQNKKGEQMKLRSNFSVDKVTDGYVILTDRYDFNNPTMSVTNDAEAVVEFIVYTYGNKRIYYYDTDYLFDELCHDNGVFTGFKPAKLENI